MRYLFEEFTLDTDCRELRQGAASRPVEPQVFDLLVHLIANRARVVSKDDLIVAIWKGRIVSESALTTRINAARTAIGDSGQEQRLIKTYLRRGVRFVGEVREDQRSDVSTRLPAVQHAPGINAVDGAVAEPRPVLGLSHQPSIAVLPFTNMSDDPDQGFFADGIVEEITAALSRLRWFFVISRNSSFTFKGKSVDVRRVGEALGARYVLEGSVRKVGSRVRVTSLLSDAAHGIQLWADRFEGVMEQVFELQDRVTQGVVTSIEPQVRLAELRRTRRKRPENLTAYDYYLQAPQCVYALTPNDTSQALRLLALAQSNDPNYAAASALAAFCLMQRRQQGWSESGERDAADSLRLAEKALICDVDDPLVLWTTGHAITALGRDQARGRLLLDRALALNPNSAQARCASGWNHDHVGDHQAALADFRLAQRLSPLDPMNYYVSAGTASAYMKLREYKLAVTWARRAVRERPCHAGSWRILAIAFAYLGELENARESIRHALHVDASLTIATMTTARSPPIDAEDLEHYLDGLRLAGLPEK